MRQIAENEGKFEIEGNSYPRLQFWQIDDLYTWWFVKWDNGKLGWSAEADIDGTLWIRRK